MSEIDWIRAIELWKSGGAVTNFLRDEFPKLRDSNGDPLPACVSEFLDDLLWCRIEPKKRRAINKSDIRMHYHSRMQSLKFWRVSGIQAFADPTGILLSDDGSDREKIIREIACIWKISESLVDTIIYPRFTKKEKSQRLKSGGNKR